MAGVVIVGAGQAGFQAAASLRAEGYAESITLIGDEPHLPYQRPPLSKEFLLGKWAIDKVDLRPLAFYEQQRIALLTGERVASIDRASHRVLLASGTSVEYSKLIFATGARVKSLPIESAMYLRGRDDAMALRERFEAVRSVAIVGGGSIGLEVAAAANALGKNRSQSSKRSHVDGPRGGAADFRFLSRSARAPRCRDLFRQCHDPESRLDRRGYRRQPQ